MLELKEYVYGCVDLATIFIEHVSCNVGTTHSNTHSLFVVLHTGYREEWSVCVFIKMVIGYNWIHFMRDLTPSTHL